MSDATPAADREPIAMVLNHAEALVDCSAFEVDLLLAMESIGPAKGQAIRGQLLDRYAEVKHARLYSNLDRVVDRGFATKEAVDGRTNHYDLSHTGEALVRAYARYVTEHVGGEVDEH